MKTIYNIISTILLCFIVGTSCKTISPEDIFNNNIGGGENINIRLCTDWGITKEEVKAKMNGYTLDKETEDILYLSANNTSHIVSYEFCDGELCTALLMVPEDMVSDSSILKFVSGYTDVGYIDDSMVYLNEDKNTVATYGTETDNKVHYKALGLTRLDIGIPRNMFYYTTTDNKKLTPNISNPFNVNILSNKYNDGIGIIICDGDITYIETRAFECCSTLKSVILPDNIASIGNSAFRLCPALTNIFIPDSVTSIGEGAFGYCTSLISITIPDGVTSVKNLFLGSSGLSRISGRYATYDNRCYIIDGVLTAFAPAGLISYTIPYEVISIGYAAFANGASLTNITIPNSVTSIEDYAFYECYGLTSVTIPNSVTSIGEGAFAWCDGLTDVTIGNSVTEIGKHAFSRCTSLTSVYCKATTPPAGDSYMFAVNATGRKIYVPLNSVEAYKSAEGWKEYAEDIVGYDF